MITRTSLADQATGWLREKITRGDWPVGSRIPAEPELVAMTGLGRNTVREAVKALTYAGLLETRHGEGTFVHSANEIEAALRRATERATARHIQEMRRALETEAARLAADRRTPADLDRLRASFATRAATGPDAFVEADLDFHQTVVDAAHNPVLAELYSALAGHLACSMRATLPDRDAPQHNDVLHDDLLRAVEAGDPEAAATAAFDGSSEILRVLENNDVPH